MADKILAYPLFWTVLTLALSAVSVLFLNATKNVLKLPKIFSIYLASVLAVVVIELCGGDFDTYKKGGDYITWFLYPATVALAIPLYKSRREIMRNLPEVAAATVISGVVSVASIYAICVLCNIDEKLMRSILAKCVTTPVAIEITKMTRGIEGIAVCAVCITGVLGAFCGHTILERLKIKNDLSIGLAIGATSHVIGTAKCLEKSQTQAAAGALVLILSAVFSAVLIALLF